jgi:hypothetical protein
VLRPEPLRLAAVGQPHRHRGEGQLQALLDELLAYPAPEEAPEPERGALLTPLQLRTEHGVLSLIGTITVFGTANDVTLAELALETLFPADAASAAYLRGLATTR